MSGYPNSQPSAPYPTDNAGNMPQPYQTNPNPKPPAYEDISCETFPPDDFVKPGLSDKSIRRRFIRKVYLILTSQLLITLTIVCVFTFIPVVRDGVRRYSWLYYISYAVFLVTYFTLACCVDCRRRAPANYICLFVFTLAMSYMAGTIASFHRTEAVLIAISMTIVLCLGITLFSVQTKWDFTICSGLVFVLSLCVLLIGISCLIVNFTLGGNRVLQAVYAGLVLILFSVLLVIDTQEVVGGRKYQLSEEEYIFGAMQLYVDMVMILIALIGLSGASD